MSARECPAKDWPRMTVKVPTTPETMATTPPTISATWTGELEKNPGSNTGARDPSSLTLSDPGICVMVSGGVASGHDQNPFIDMHDIDLMAVEVTQGLGGDHFFCGATGHPAGGDVDDVVHNRKQRV